MKLIASELARRAGISRQAVACAIVEGALVRQENYLIDTMNDINQDWLRRRGIEPQKVDVVTRVEQLEPEVIPVRKEKKKEERTALTEADVSSITGLPEKLLGMTIMELTLKHGGPMQLKSYVDILNTTFAAMKKDVEVQEKRRQLVEKDFVQGHLFQFIEIMVNQIFDYPESILEEFISQIKADEDKARYSLPEKMRKDFSKIINEAKRLIKIEIEKNKKKRHSEEE